MKKQKSNPTNSLLFSFLKNSKRYFVMSIFCIFLINILSLLVPKLIAFTIDSLIHTNDPNLSPFSAWLIEKAGGLTYLREHIYLMAGVLGVFAVFAAFFEYLKLYWNTKGSEIFIKKMREDIYTHLMHLPFSFHTENKTGDIIQRCTSDIEQVKNFVSKQIPELLKTLVLIFLSLSFMLTISLKLSLVSLLLLSFNLVYSYFRQKIINDGWKKSEEAFGLLSAITQENISGVRVVRAFGKEAYEVEKFNRQRDKIYDLWKNLNLIFASYWSTMNFIINLQILVVTVYGVILSIRGELLAGEFIAFISYNLMLSWPFMGLTRIITNFSKVRVAYDRMKYIMNAPVESDEGKKLTPSMRETISFDHISFSYNEDSKIFDDVSFLVHPGETVGILGGTGSGKSTLFYLLTRLYPLKEGRISIGGVNIADIELSYLRKNIGYVLQEPYLFSGTISENIGLGTDSSSQELIEEAAGISSLTKTIQEFTKGYETFVGEKGVTLSGGQKQRIAIARMVIGDAPIMLFDDSLSAVDTETDANIRKSLSEKSGKTTRLIISHRITTLMHSDKIIVLDDGKLVESGTHDELLEKNGIYKKLYDIQGIRK